MTENDAELLLNRLLSRTQADLCFLHRLVTFVSRRELWAGSTTKLLRKMKIEQINCFLPVLEYRN